MTGNGRYHGKTPNVAASVSDLTHDVIELSELQVQLLSLDARQSVAKAKACLVMAVIGASVLLGTIPVALLAIAALLVDLLEWPYSAAIGVATGIGLVLAAIVLAVAYRYVKNGLVTFDRSREELQRNIAWLKSTLKTRGHVERSAAQSAEQPINF
jgi:uncharacterized membrane protein YqjE